MLIKPHKVGLFKPDLKSSPAVFSCAESCLSCYFRDHKFSSGKHNSWRKTNNLPPAELSTRKATENRNISKRTQLDPFAIWAFPSFDTTASLNKVRRSWTTRLGVNATSPTNGRGTNRRGKVSPFHDVTGGTPRRRGRTEHEHNNKQTPQLHSLKFLVYLFSVFLLGLCSFLREKYKYCIRLLEDIVTAREAKSSTMWSNSDTELQNRSDLHPLF